VSRKKRDPIADAEALLEMGAQTVDAPTLARLLEHTHELRSVLAATESTQADMVNDLSRRLAQAEADLARERAKTFDASKERMRLLKELREDMAAHLEELAQDLRRWGS
jgi:hypothetical protein